MGIMIFKSFSTSECCYICDPEGKETARNTLASLVSGRLLRWSLGTTGFCDVTKKNDGVYPYDVIEINLTVNDRPHGERKRPSN